MTVEVVMLETIANPHTVETVMPIVEDILTIN